MSKYEELVSMKAELKAMKARIDELENAQPTKENLELVEAIKERANQMKVYIRLFARKYGMVA